MYRRFLMPEVMAALGDTPVVLVTGARQTGKSTLVQHVSAKRKPAHQFTFDDLTTLNAARGDPQGFIAGLSGPVVIDEIQRVPEVLLPIKAAVDRDRQPGRFLLTGSANVMMLPRLADTLAGRMEVITLRPLSQGEMAGSPEHFLDRLFGAEDPRWRSLPTDRADLLTRVAGGGYPEVQTRQAGKRRDAWFSAYLTTILGRDLRDLTGIDALAELPRVLKALASRTANLLNYADVARDLAVPLTTLRRHVGLLTAAFLVQELPAWSINISKRLVKAPKALITDTGLAAHLLGVTVRDPAAGTGGQEVGALVESFVGNELLKQIGWHDPTLTLHHFRTHVGEEVDFVLEAPDGSIAGVEVKLSATLTGREARGLRTLREAAGKRFRRGVVLYAGNAVVPIDGQRAGQGDGQITAVPMRNLWS
jgi:predicted AAA+ superfamily ATPase